jgi:hypothetical protein
VAVILHVSSKGFDNAGRVNKAYARAVARSKTSQPFLC